MSADICWQIIRNNNAFLLKKRNINRPFSMEPNNLKNVSSSRYNGFCTRKVLGIEAESQGKGIVLIHKKSKGQAALRRASAILRSQRAVPFKKGRRGHKVITKKSE